MFATTLQVVICRDARLLLSCAAGTWESLPETRHGTIEALLPWLPLHQRLCNMHSIFSSLWWLPKPPVFSRLRWSAITLSCWRRAS